MKPHVFVTETVSQRNEVLRHRGRGPCDGSVRLVGEHESIIRHLCVDECRSLLRELSLGFEDLQSVDIERDPPTRAGFNASLFDAARHFNDGALDRELHQFRVDVAPTNGADLTSSCTGLGRNMNEVPDVGISFRCGVYQLANLHGVRGSEVGLGLSGWRGVGRGIGCDPAPENGLTERSSNYRVYLADGRR